MTGPDAVAVSAVTAGWTTVRVTQAVLAHIRSQRAAERTAAAKSGQARPPAPKEPTS